MPHQKSMCLAVLAAVGFAGASTARAVVIPTPILEYTFNDNAHGATVASTGSDAHGLTFHNSNADNANTSVNLRGASGSGVSGLTGDYAFINTKAGGMGTGDSNGKGGYAQGYTAPALDNLSKWTVSGWLKTAGTETMGSGAFLFANNSSSNNTGFRAVAKNSSALTLTHGNTSQDVTLSGSALTIYQETSTWIFYAITYDGATVRTYFGNQTGVLAAGGTWTTSAAGMGTPTPSLTIGNNGQAPPKTAAAFDGYLDNTRVFGSALASDQLTQLRDNDYTTGMVPEPAGMAVLGMLSTMLLARRRRRIA